MKIPMKPGDTCLNSQVVLFIFLHLLLLWFVSSGVALADTSENWHIVKHDSVNDIVIYKRKLSGGYTEFTAITHIDSSLSAVVALFRDTNAMPHRVDRTVKTEILQWLSDTEIYVYNVSRLGWPFKQRDTIIHSVLSQDPTDLSVMINGSNTKEHTGPNFFDYQKDENQYVRMILVKSSWIFKPLNSNLIKVTFQGYGDPGGNTSAPLFKWLIGKMAWESPYKTLKSMKKIISLDVYQNAKFDFIKELLSFNKHD